MTTKSACACRWLSSFCSRGWHRRLKVDVLHGQANPAPLHADVPLVLTLFDVIPFTERTMSLASRLPIREIARRAAPRACAVIRLTESA